MSRKFIVHLAVSADGFIARKNGAFDFLDRPAPEGHYGMAKFLKSIDAIVWGRKTWDMNLMMGNANAFGPKVRNHVFSRNPKSGPEYVTESIADFARRERGEPGKNLWIMGGSEIVGAFLDAGAVDELLLVTIPVMIGEGIPLVQAKPATVELQLLAAKKYSDGAIRSHYRVIR
jgi:dihydrofolate reductase